MLEQIRAATRELALAIGVVGLLNVQYAVVDGPAVRARGQPARLAHRAVRLQGRRPAAGEARLPRDARRAALRAGPPARARRARLRRPRLGQGGGAAVRPLRGLRRGARPGDALHGGGDGDRARLPHRVRQGAGRRRLPAAAARHRLHLRHRRRQGGRLRDRRAPARERLSHPRHTRHRRGDRAHGDPRAGAEQGLRGLPARARLDRARRRRPRRQHPHGLGRAHRRLADPPRRRHPRRPLPHHARRRRLRRARDLLRPPVRPPAGAVPAGAPPRARTQADPSPRARFPPPRLPDRPPRRRRLPRRRALPRPRRSSAGPPGPGWRDAVRRAVRPRAAAAGARTGASAGGCHTARGVPGPRLRTPCCGGCSPPATRRSASRRWASASPARSGSRPGWTRTPAASKVSACSASASSRSAPSPPTRSPATHRRVSSGCSATARCSTGWAFPTRAPSAVAARLRRRSGRVVVGANVGKSMVVPLRARRRRLLRRRARARPRLRLPGASTSARPTRRGSNRCRRSSCCGRCCAKSSGSSERCGVEVPLLVKVGPDLADRQLLAIADLALELGA